MKIRSNDSTLRRENRRVEPLDHSLDLQFFAAEDEGRTEEPTEKKREEAREEGQVPQTEELLHAIVMGAGFLIIWFLGSWMYNELHHFTIDLMSKERIANITPGNIHSLITDICWLLVKIVGPVAVAGFAASIFGTWVQTGPMFTLQPMAFDLSNIQPSFSKLMEETLFSRQVFWDFMKSLVKVFVVGGVAAEVIYNNYEELLILVDVPLIESVQVVLNLAFEIIIKTILILLILSPIDYTFEWFEQEEDLKMTPREKEDEQKQQEGDPEIQQKQREKMREASEQRMMEEVPEADVVVTNPTHYAVALQFEMNSMDAPEITAKGKNFMAQRIREIAKDNEVPVYEVPLLARSLYQLELGEQIPRVLYEAVAVVFSWVEKDRTDVPREEAADVEQQVKEADLAPAS